MPRELKFRAWDKRTEKMFDNGILLESGRQLVVFAKRMRSDIPDMNNAKGGLFLPTDDENLVFMQFIGLYDRNRKEIFEGDVIRNLSGEIGTVELHKSWAAFFFKLHFGYNEYGELVQMMGSRPVYNDWSKYEVIGNIFENPELLEVLKDA